MDGADAAFAKVIAAQPDNADALFNRGNMLYNKGQWQASADSYAKAIALKPDMAHAHFNRGMALLHLAGSEADAAAEFKAANKLDPSLTAPK